MLSTFLYILATLFLSLNFIRPFGLAISDWLYISALFSALVETLISRNNIFFSTWVPRNFFFWPTLLIIIGAAFSFGNSQNQSIAIVETFQTIYVITVFISLTAIMVKRGKTELIITVFILSGIFTSIVVAIDFFEGTNWGPILSNTPYLLFTGRYAGTLGHPNKLGYFLVLTFILTFSKFQVAKDRKLSLGLISIILVAIIVQGWGIYLSGSVTAYIGLLSGLFCLFLTVIPQKSQKTIYSLVIVLVIAAMLFISLWISGLVNMHLVIPENSLIGIGINRVINSTAGIRMDLYRSSIEYIIQSPVIGAGFDQNSTSPLEEELRILNGSIHNPFLQMWYTGGFFAFLGWLILHFSIGKIAVINLFQNSINKFILNNSISAAVVALIIMDQFQSGIYQREKWLVIGILVSRSWLKRPQVK